MSNSLHIKLSTFVILLYEMIVIFFDEMTFMQLLFQKTNNK